MSIWESRVHTVTVVYILHHEVDHEGRDHRASKCGKTVSSGIL